MCTFYYCISCRKLLTRIWKRKQLFYSIYRKIFHNSVLNNIMSLAFGSMTLHFPFLIHLCTHLWKVFSWTWPHNKCFCNLIFHCPRCLSNNAFIWCKNVTLITFLSKIVTAIFLLSESKLAKISSSRQRLLLLKVHAKILIYVTSTEMVLMKITYRKLTY